MKTQEVNFKCRSCEHDLAQFQSQCMICGFLVEWEETVKLDYEDKYLQIFTVLV